VRTLRRERGKEGGIARLKLKWLVTLVRWKERRRRRRRKRRK